MSLIGSSAVVWIIHGVLIPLYFRPVDKNKAVITLSAAAVQAEFEIGEGTVTLIKFASGNKPPVKGIQDKPMMLAELIKEMRRQGVDIFPDHDSHCYIEGLPLKESTSFFSGSIAVTRI